MLTLWLLQRLEQQIKTRYQLQVEELQQQLSAASAQAEARLKEKTAADKEWAKRLAAKEKEGQGRLKEADAKLKELEERSKLHVDFYVTGKLQ